MNFTKKKEYARSLKNKLKENQNIYNDHNDFNFLFEYFKLNKDYENIFHKGCIGFCLRQREDRPRVNLGFNMIHNDNSESVVSINFSLKKRTTDKEKVHSAFRNCVEPIIMDFKKDFVAGYTKCEISGVIIDSNSNLHIDHNEVDFNEICFLFLKKWNVTYEMIIPHIEKVGTYWIVKNQKLINNFIDFHNKNTTLRFTHKIENLKKTKTIFKNV